MAEKRTTPEAPSGRRRKRAAPTIDLKATEVATEGLTPEQATAAPGPAPEEPQPAAKPEAAFRSRQTHSKKETAKQSAEQGAEPPASEQQDSPPPPPPPPPPWHGGMRSAVAGGIAGAVILAAAAGGLWYGGFVPLEYGNDRTGALRAQIAALQKQVQDLQNRPAPAAPDTGAIDQSIAALGRRVDSIEQSVANIPPGDKSIADRVAAADNAMKSLGVALTALNRRSDDIAAKAVQAQEQAAATEKAVSDLRTSVQNASRQSSGAVEPGQFNDVRQRIAALEQSIKSVRADLDRSIKALGERINTASAVDRAARLALSASVLQTAVASGASYKAELTQAKWLGADQQALAPLDRFAASGLPDKSALAEQLLDVLPAMRKAAGADETASFLDRLQANASKLVRIRPIEAPAGHAPADVLARIEVEAAHDNIAGALGDLAKLPPTVRAPADDWIAKAKARQDALAAAQSFAAETARALGNG